MAHTFLPLSTITFLLFLSHLIVTTASTTNGDSLVLDADGKPLEPGSPYYIRTELSKVGIGGGILTASKPNLPQCPQYVAQLALGWEGESPVTFYPTNPSQKHIHVSSDINIIFNTTSSACSQGAWQLTPDATNGNLYLSTGKLGSETVANRLKIERSHGSDGFYQLEFCPTTDDGRNNEIVCGAIDALDETVDHRMVWLGLTSHTPNFFNGLSFLKA